MCFVVRWEQMLHFLMCNCNSEQIGNFELLLLTFTICKLFLQTCHPIALVTFMLERYDDLYGELNNGRTDRDRQNAWQEFIDTLKVTAEPNFPVQTITNIKKKMSNLKGDGRFSTIIQVTIKPVY